VRDILCQFSFYSSNLESNLLLVITTKMKEVFNSQLSAIKILDKSDKIREACECESCFVIIRG